MTLIISVRCTDGFVIISDRKEGQGSSSNNVSKCLLSPNNDFFIALAGNGGLPRGILSILNSSTITSTTVITEIETYVRTFNSRVDPASRSDCVKGFLVVSNEANFTLKILDILGQIVTTLDVSSPISYIGFTPAKIFAQHFLEKYPLDKMTCEKATKYVLAVMNELAKSIPEVGGFDFGYDVNRFSATNGITSQIHFTDSNVAKFHVDINISNSNSVFPKDVTTESQTNV